jgi:hypothetical protein
MDQLPFRQIHLDFHTSEKVPGVGKDWSKAHFQEMLQLGHVSSITVFSKCHHGWSYHPTEVPLSRQHPTMTPGFDMTGAMVEAAHEIGVQTPVYISVGLDEKLVNTHSHWLRRNADGGLGWSNWLQAGYHEFCLRSPYLPYVVAQAEEVARRYPLAEGFFLDIVGVRDCACQWCVSEMLQRGMDPRDAAARVALGRETYVNYCRTINAAVHAINPKIRMFHNGGHINRGDRELANLNTHHLELESLPTGGWGYDHFPLSARYVQGLGREFLGMTGKFHTTWGEFGGYKHPNALRFENSLSLANGAKISVGDQMHPFGQLDKATYTLIGAAYGEVEQKEPWCTGTTNVADVAVFSAEAMQANRLSGPGVGQTDAGVVRVLQEGGLLYDIIDRDTDLSGYRLVVLPDAIPVDDALRAKLNAFMAGGGKIFATGDSALQPDGTFALDFGVTAGGESPTSPCYVVPGFALDNWANGAFVIYSTAKALTLAGGDTLAVREDAFFNRDYLHFCSHQHAPNTKEAAGPLMVATPNTVYLGIPAFSLYAEKGQNVLRDVLLHGLRRLLPAPTLTTSLPAQGIHTVQRQAADGRTVVHLIYGAPVRRGQGIEVVEDLVPVFNIAVALRADAAPKRVYLAPQQDELPFTYEDGQVKTVVPVVECHQMVVIE